MPTEQAPSHPHLKKILPKLLLEAEVAQPPEAALMPFDPAGRFAQTEPFGLEEYLELVDTMGRAVHPKKRGAIPPN